MIDARANLLADAPDLVAKLDAAIAAAHRTGKVQTLADGFAVYSKNQPLIVRRKGLDDPEGAATEGPWPAFFARLYALALRADVRWGEVGTVFACPATQSELAGRVIKQLPRVEIRWGPPVARAAEPPSEAAAPTPEEVAAARARDEAAEREREALYARRRAERAAEQKRRDEATDIGGVAIASMGKSVTLPATDEVVRGLKKLPPAVRRLILKGGSLQGTHIGTTLASLTLDAIDLTGNALCAEDVVALPTAKLGIQKLPDDASLDVGLWDYRKADPDRVYRMWFTWLERATQAAATLFERHGAAATSIPALLPKRPESGAPWEEWCDAVYAWGDATAAWAPRQKDVQDANLKRSIRALREAADGILTHEDGDQSTHEDSDQPYDGIDKTCEALPFLVGASLVSSADRPAWLVSRAEIERIRSELREAL